MPIIDVELVVDANATVSDVLAQSLADAIGRTLDSPPGQTWVRMRVLQRENYAENQSSVAADDLPVFVGVQKRTLPDQPALAVEIAALTRSIASVTGRKPASVHVEYAPAAAGRRSFGGKLVE